MVGKTRCAIQTVLTATFCTLFLVSVCMAQTTAFTFQGKLTDAGNPANGNYDMQFKLFDTPTVGTGTQQGSTLTRNPVAANAGIFTVMLDFGATVFDGSVRYVEIGVRPAGSPNPYTVLAPRTQITASPYAVDSVQLGGVPAIRYIKSDANGNVAIGPGTAAHRLAVLGGPAWTGDAWGGAVELDNAAAIAWRQNTSGVKFGIGRTENGLFFFRTNSPLGTTTNGPTYDLKMDNNGNVGIGTLGIGTDLSSARLTLFNSGAGFGLKHTDGIVTLGTKIGTPVPPDNIRGGWIGTESNHKLYLFANAGGPSLTIDTNSNVGIGTINPTQLLHVNSASGNAAALVQTPTNAFAQLQLKSGATNAWTIGTQDNFVGNALLFRNGSTDLMAIQPGGSITQPRDKNGIVKAMVFINGDATILRCYNGQTGSSTGNCGFTATRGGLASSGEYIINFGFQVDDRFWVATPDGGCCNDAISVHVNASSANSLHIFVRNQDVSATDRPVMLIVY